MQRLAAWLAAHGGGDAVQPRQIAADTGLRLKSVRAALDALDRAGYIAKRPSISIGAQLLLLRE